MALETTEQPTAAQAAEQTAEQTETCCGSSRRALLRTAGAGAAAATVGLTAAACGSSSGGSSNANPGDAAGAGTSPAATSSDSGSSGSGSGSVGSALAQTSDVPVDGGKIVNSDGGIVITQPAAGTYKAFTAVCTHQGCTVGSVSDNQIVCPCHGSVFSAKDGSVVQGPAQAPLAAMNIKVSGGQIFLA
ncbi:Rieske (2Fe-2S) protein [Actinocrinis puniceicyclus]|uniref:Cytochrome bc1 complex Rieske iron-sulfur subunit n=1 Tax=Actinocrinis puniceicyclus TaxID=977794 RepID=A0A8J8BFR5_9ACTN|nr:Rieske (2Fe-2S) protein [Actinocrinis puniceicyclus]MBS2966426.1 Rieske (2Fe-2S) protein [Actinocrinis puniceicyclus]